MVVLGRAGSIIDWQLQYEIEVASRAIPYTLTSNLTTSVYNLQLDVNNINSFKQDITNIKVAIAKTSVESE